MPRYYCDYCDTYLTHDSPSVRKQHNSGYKHKANVRTYYQQFEEQQTQSLIDQRIKEHLGQAAAFQHQVGATFHQHLAALPGQRPPPRLPILPIPISPVPGSLNPQPLLSIRPPVLPRPLPVYGAAPILPHGATPPGSLSFPPQSNGPSMPPLVNFPATAGMPTALPEAPQRPALGGSGGPAPATSNSQDSFGYSETSHNNQQG